MADYYKTYTRMPNSAADYTMMRGVTDFGNAAQFNLFESGYSFLVILTKPDFMEALAEKDSDIKKLFDTFCHILEYEFKGLDGIDNITTEDLEYSDGISTINAIGKVTQQSNAEVTMNFTEKCGAPITKFVELYLRCIKDPRTQAKTYGGLIESGQMAAGFEHEVFNLLYMVTDNTLLTLEKSYLLVNAYPSTANTDIYNSTKGEIQNKEISLPWKCFIIDGEEVDKRAIKMLTYINGKNTLPHNTGTNKVANAYYSLGNTDSAEIAAKIANEHEHPVETKSSKFQYSGLEDIDEAIN